MDTLEPLINLLALLSILSIAAERLTNVLKLRTRRTGDHAQKDKRERERQIGHQALAMSIALAILVKADFFQIIGHLNAPWETLGWVRLSGDRLAPGAETRSVAHTLYTVAGSTLTGISLGFGSKFWHDILDIVYRTRRSLIRATRETS